MESKPATRAQKQARVYFGWWTVLTTGIVSGLGHGFYGYGFSVFFKDLAASLVCPATGTDGASTTRRYRCRKTVFDVRTARQYERQHHDKRSQH